MQPHDKITSLRFFSLTAGGFLLFISFSTLTVFNIHRSEIDKIGLKVLHSPVFVFVNLSRSVRKPYSGRYFFSYSGKFSNSVFKKSERVNSDFYHLTSEGKNVQARVYSDRWGNIYTMLRENTLAYGKEYVSLSIFLTVTGITGVLLFALGALLSIPGKNRARRRQGKAQYEDD